MSDLDIVAKNIEEILSHCSEAEIKYILDYLNENYLKNEKRKKEPVQEGD